MYIIVIVSTNKISLIIIINIDMNISLKKIKVNISKNDRCFDIFVYFVYIL